ncbi:MAG: metallophosphoesterase [bacterium]
MIIWDNHPKIEFKLSEFYDKFGNNYQAIADELSKAFPEYKFTYNSVRNRIRRPSSIIEYIPNKRGKGIFEGLDDNYLFNDYSEAKEDIIDNIDFFKQKYGDKTVNILVISDLHIPKEDLNVLEKILLNNQDCNVLVIAGDLLDYDNLSSFGQKRNINVTDEYKRAFSILKRIVPMFEDVFIFNGNHENRFINYITHKTVTSISGYLTDKHKPLSQIVSYFDNVHYISHWFLQLGDVIFSHPSRYSKIEGRTVRNVVDNRIEKSHEKKFDLFNAVVCGHTHRTFKGEFKGKIAIENGCIEQKGVEFSNKDAKGKEWHHGYTKITMRNGNTSWNDINVYRV